MQNTLSREVSKILTSFNKHVLSKQYLSLYGYTWLLSSKLLIYSVKFIFLNISKILTEIRI